MLEQLRVLWYGEKIHVAVAATVPSVGVDTPDDLLRVREAMQPGISSSARQRNPGWPQSLIWR